MRAVRGSVVVSVGLAVVWVASAPALAQQDPPGCSQTGIAIAVSVFRGNGTTGVTGTVASCETLNYQVTLSKADPNSTSICAFSGGTFTLTTPDGVVHTISTNVPCIGGTGVAPGCSAAVTSLTSDLIPYSVRLADVVGGFLHATASYGIGVVHDGPIPTFGASATTPKTNPFAATCADRNLCTIDLCDPRRGCVHQPSKKCILAPPHRFSWTNALDRVTFKRQEGIDDTGSFLKIALQEVVLASENGELVKRKVKVNAVVTGPDAAVGSLLYPVVALGAGNGALAALQAKGYDVSVTGALTPCTDTLPADTCSALAKQLAQGMEAQLALGDEDERDAFRQGLQSLGYLPDQCCAPTTCAALNANCGSLPDGCGGTLQCGTCTLPATCGGAGEQNRCGVFL